MPAEVSRREENPGDKTSIPRRASPGFNRHQPHLLACKAAAKILRGALRVPRAYSPPPRVQQRRFSPSNARAVPKIFLTQENSKKDGWKKFRRKKHCHFFPNVAKVRACNQAALRLALNAKPVWRNDRRTGFGIIKRPTHRCGIGFGQMFSRYRAGKLLHIRAGSEPRTINPIWLMTKSESHLNAASVKP